MVCSRCKDDLNLKNNMKFPVQSISKSIKMGYKGNEGVTSTGAIEEYWCLAKHLLAAEGHAEENIANASRDGDSTRVEELGLLLNIVRSMRQGVVQMALTEEK